MIRSGSVLLSSVMTIAIALSVVSCRNFSGSGFNSSWEKYPDTRWAGPEIWVNRLADWEVKDGRLTCTGTLPMRTAHVTTAGIKPEEGSISILVNIRRSITGSRLEYPSAGVLLGAGGEQDYRASLLVFHSWGQGGGLYIGLDGAGKVFVRDFSRENIYPAYAVKSYRPWNEAILKINVEPSSDDHVSVDIIAVDPSTRTVISELKDVELPSERFTGNVALVSHPGYGRDSKETFSFSHFSLRGSRIEKNNNHHIGPQVTAQYTLSRGILKLTAQLMPVEKGLCDSVEFQLFDENKWQTAATAPVDTPSFTASFRFPGWSGSEDRPYRLVARYRYGRGNVNTLTGIIKHDPVEKESIKVLSMSCNEQVIKPFRDKWAGIDAGSFDYGSMLLFPHARQVENLKRHDADLLFYAGDQVYEGASPTAADFGRDAILDYLYKWYLWCITNRDLTTVIPSVTIPDDHDVYHGNLWGSSGRATPPGLSGADAQDAGGYRMSARFVNMVETTQTSHLPDPVDPRPVEGGIGVYFTECNVGGISFAIIEDRKFKSAPRDMLPEALIYNGWPQNQQWNPARKADIPGATLLGDRQYAFLERWADDWSGGTWMKAVLSQTLWANLATLPDSATNDAVVPSLEIPDSGVYVTGDRIVTDFDSDGWPQSGRNRALRIMRKAFALHICGDQHLPSTVKYGTDEWGDAGYAIVSPATGNIFPRRWFPPSPGTNRKEGDPDYTGEFEDGFGNKITVLAVANPHKTKVQPIRHNELVTGYSSIVFNHQSG